MTLLVMIMIVESSETRIWEAEESDSWCADISTLCTGEGLGWGWLEGCTLFLSTAFFLCGFYLFSVSNLPLTFLTDESQVSHSEASCCLGWRLIPFCASDFFSWSLLRFFRASQFVFFILELAEEDCFGHVHVFQPYDLVICAQVNLRQDGLCAGQAGCLQEFFIIWHAFSLVGAKNGAQAALVKTLK